MLTCDACGKNQNKTLDIDVVEGRYATTSFHHICGKCNKETKEILNKIAHNHTKLRTQEQDEAIRTWLTQKQYTQSMTTS